jgi:virginiamycin A acetyltransferase
MSLREFCKWAARLAAHCFALPFLLIHALKVPILGKDRALEGSTQLVALFPGLCGNYVRRAFLSWTIHECHPSATVSFGTILSKTAACIGANAYVGPYCSLGSVTIERDALIATGVHILSGGRIHGTDDPDRPIREQTGEISHVTIGAGTWIGAGAVIMADIGRASIVGAGAVVTRPIPDQVIAAGVPARVLRSRLAADSKPELGEPGA